ncbi:unnamed protein product [Rhodiola kirilowii]
MGCCLSRDGRRSVAKEAPLAVKLSPEKEVETVKEILEQTPTPAVKPAAEIELPKLDQTKKSSVKVSSEDGSVVEDEASPEKREAPGIEEVVVEEKSLKFKLPVTDDVSDVSEAYSRSTTTVTEIRDDTDDIEVASNQVKQRLNRSPARYSNRGSAQRLATTRHSNGVVSNNTGCVNGNGGVSNYKPHRQSNQSPLRKPAEARPAVRQSPVRRTVSPAARRVNGPSSVKNGPSGPNRVGHGRMLMEESLENPLVSLECFIFL